MGITSLNFYIVEPKKANLKKKKANHRPDLKLQISVRDLAPKVKFKSIITAADIQSSQTFAIVVHKDHT